MCCINKKTLISFVELSVYMTYILLARHPIIV